MWILTQEQIGPHGLNSFPFVFITLITRWIFLSPILSPNYKFTQQSGYTVGELTMVHEKYFRVGLPQSNLSSEKLKPQSPVSHAQPPHFSRYPFFLAFSFSIKPGPSIPPQQPPPRPPLLPPNCFTTRLFQEECIKQIQ